MTITVHHLNNSRSQRVLWLLEELGLPYAVKRYERNALKRDTRETLWGGGAKKNKNDDGKKKYDPEEKERQVNRP